MLGTVPPFFWPKGSATRGPCLPTAATRADEIHLPTAIEPRWPETDTADQLAASRQRIGPETQEPFPPSSPPRGSIPRIVVWPDRCRKIAIALISRLGRDSERYRLWVLKKSLN